MSWWRPGFFVALTVALCAMWWRSGTRSDVLALRSPTGHLQALASHRGGVIAFTSDVPFETETRGWVQTATVDSEEMDALNSGANTVLRSFLGFKFASGTVALGVSAPTPNYHVVRVPHWAIAVVFGGVGVMLLRAPIRRRCWVKQGRCAACGYDLRGSPMRCPECGRAVGEPATPQPTSWRRYVRLSPGFLLFDAVVLVILAMMLVRPPQSKAAFIICAYDLGDLAGKPHWDSDEEWFDGDRCVESISRRRLTVREVHQARLSGVCDAAEWATLPTNFESQAELTLGDRVIFTAPPAAHAQYAALLQALRSPAGAAFTTVVAGDLAPRTKSASEAERKLKQVFPELRFDGTLELAINELREKTHLNLVVDWGTVESGGVERGSPVKLHLWDVTARQALNVLLADVGGGLVSLAFRVEDEGIVRITITDALEIHSVVRIYDVRQLLLDGAHSEKALWEATHVTKPTTRSTPAEAREDVDDFFRALVMETVNPDSWRENGGSVGGFSTWAGRWIIRQTPENHREIERFLKDLSAEFGKDDGLPGSQPTTKPQRFEPSPTVPRPSRW